MKTIKHDIHKLCEQFGGTKKSHYVNYLDGANISGFIKLADAMVAYNVV